MFQQISLSVLISPYNIIQLIFHEIFPNEAMANLKKSLRYWNIP